MRSLAPTLAATDGSPQLRLCAISPGGVRTDLVPTALRGVTEMMAASVLAEEALDLCLTGENGEVRAKIRSDEPARTFHAPRIDLVQAR